MADRDCREPATSRSRPTTIEDADHPPCPANDDRPPTYSEATYPRPNTQGNQSTFSIDFQRNICSYAMIESPTSHSSTASSSSSSPNVFTDLDMTFCSSFSGSSDHSFQDFPIDLSIKYLRSSQEHDHLTTNFNDHSLPRVEIPKFDRNSILPATHPPITIMEPDTVPNLSHKYLAIRSPQPLLEKQKQDFSDKNSCIKNHEFLPNDQPSFLPSSPKPCGQLPNIYDLLGGPHGPTGLPEPLVPIPINDILEDFDKIQGIKPSPTVHPQSEVFQKASKRHIVELDPSAPTPLPSKKICKRPSCPILQSPLQPCTPCMTFLCKLCPFKTDRPVSIKGHLTKFHNLMHSNFGSCYLTVLYKAPLGSNNSHSMESSGFPSHESFSHNEKKGRNFPNLDGNVTIDSSLSSEGSDSSLHSVSNFGHDQSQLQHNLDENQTSTGKDLNSEIHSPASHGGSLPSTGATPTPPPPNFANSLLQRNQSSTIEHTLVESTDKESQALREMITDAKATHGLGMPARWPFPPSDLGTDRGPSTPGMLFRSDDVFGQTLRLDFGNLPTTRPEWIDRSLYSSPAALMDYVPIRRTITTHSISLPQLDARLPADIDHTRSMNWSWIYHGTNNKTDRFGNLADSAELDRILSPIPHGDDDYDANPLITGQPRTSTPDTIPKPPIIPSMPSSNITGANWELPITEPERKPTLPPPPFDGFGNKFEIAKSAFQTWRTKALRDIDLSSASKTKEGDVTTSSDLEFKNMMGRFNVLQLPKDREHSEIPAKDTPFDTATSDIYIDDDNMNKDVNLVGPARSHLKQKDHVVVSVNHLSAEDLDDIESRVSNENSIRFKNLKDHYLNTQLHRETALQQQDNVAAWAQNTPKFQERMQIAERHTARLDEALERLEIEINQLKEAKSVKTIPIRQPIYGTTTSFKHHEVDNIPIAKGDGTVKIARIWQKICDLIARRELSEDAARTAVSSRLEGEVLDFFDIYNDLPLLDIVSNLSIQFDTPPSRSKYLTDIEEFARRTGETIEMAVMRLRGLLRGADKCRGIADRQLQEEEIIRQQLENMVDKSVWKSATDLETQQMEMCITFPLAKLIKACSKAESQQQEKRLPGIKVCLNAQDVQIEPASRSPSPKSPRTFQFQAARFDPYKKSQQDRGSRNVSTERPEHETRRSQSPYPSPQVNNERKVNDFSPSREPDGSLRIGKTGQPGYQIRNPRPNRFDNWQARPRNNSGRQQPQQNSNSFSARTNWSSNNNRFDNRRGQPMDTSDHQDHNSRPQWPSSQPRYDNRDTRPRSSSQPPPDAQHTTQGNNRFGRDNRDHRPNNFGRRDYQNQRNWSNRQQSHNGPQYRSYNRDPWVHQELGYQNNPPAIVQVLYDRNTCRRSQCRDTAIHDRRDCRLRNYGNQDFQNRGSDA